MKRFKKNVIFPIFIKCAEICKDDFWKQLFEDMGYGKHPKNIFISDKTINIGKNKPAFYFDNLSEQEIVNQLIPFLQTHTSLYSCSDLKKRKTLIQQLKNDRDYINSIKWPQIRKTTLKKIFLLNFVDAKRVEHNLSWDTATKLYNILLVEIFKQGMSKRIDYQNGVIISIDGLEFIDGDFVMEKEDEGKNKVSKTQKKFSRWENYMKGYFKTNYKKLNSSKE